MITDRSTSDAPPRRALDARSGAAPEHHDGEAATLARLHHVLVSAEEEIRALTLPLDPTGAFEVLQRRINSDLAPTVTCLLELDARTGTWSPRLATGCVLAASIDPTDLPAPLAEAIATGRPALVADLSTSGPGAAPGSRSGLYVPLSVDRELVGALAIEHSVMDRFDADDLAFATAQSRSWALTVDNVRRFHRIRALVADTHHVQVARDLHDRLGQWLALVSMELEGVIRRQATPAPELTTLYGTVQSAIEEMRDTLRQTLAGVAADRPLARVAAEICERFEERAEIDVTYETSEATLRLPVPVESELSRILLVALGNCERHARATRVSVRWSTDGNAASLTIIDDGVGFDPSRAIRDATGGLIDMRDRATAIDGQLRITSQPGAGTTVSVTIPATPKERTC